MLLRVFLGSFISLTALAAATPTPTNAIPNMTEPPKAGKVELYPEADLKPGMQAVAWTVFQGSKPEPVPVEIVGIWENAWGPKQNIIIGKMGGKAIRTNVAGGMSGSPVYIDGKLVGAISLRLSVFSPDAICGITPIRLMLEVNDFDQSKPANSLAPGNTLARNDASMSLPAGLAQRVMAAGSASNLGEIPMMTPISTPISMSGFTDDAVKEFAPVFQQLGLNVSQGGSSGNLDSSKPAKDWATSLQPGEPVAAVLVSGDVNMTGGGTVTYNDGKRILAFGHPMFNLGPVEMPLAKDEIITTLASSYQPTKMGNATEVVGALKQDRHSAIEGQLGETAQMIPVTMHDNSYNLDNSVHSKRDFHFNVFVDHKWTPYLMMATFFNAISNLNDFSEEATYRLHGELHVEGQTIELRTMQAPTEAQVPTPMILAGWWGDKFNRLFVNSAKLPKLEAVNVSVDLLPERLTAQIENAWIGDNNVTPGTSVPVKVFLRPYRGDRIERTVDVKIPAGLARGDHEILFSDADTLSRFQNIAQTLNKIEDIPQTVAMLNDERSNNRMYVSLIESQPTIYSDEKVLPSLPPSIVNVMQSGKAVNHQFVSVPESAREQLSVPFDTVVTGAYSLKIHVN